MTYSHTHLDPIPHHTAIMEEIGIQVIQQEVNKALLVHCQRLIS
jgi:hypothetical protein